MTSALEPPNELVHAVAAGRSILFAGAGVSQAVVRKGDKWVSHYLPTWGKLLVVLLDTAVRVGHLGSAESAKLKRALEAGKYLFVAETVRRVLGPREFDEAIESIFRSEALRPSKRHKLITEIPFAGVITTNYDKLLESAYAQGGHIPPVYTYEDSADIVSALSHGRFFILKAHGDIDSKSTIILSERDYRDMVYRQPGYRAAMNAIFITKTVLFLGTSLTDTDTNLVLESVSESFSGKGPRHYALLPEREASEAEGIHWRDLFGIQLIQYKATKGHPELELFLDRLRDAVGRTRKGAAQQDAAADAVKGRR